MLQQRLTETLCVGKTRGSLLNGTFPAPSPIHTFQSFLRKNFVMFVYRLYYDKGKITIAISSRQFCQHMYSDYFSQARNIYF